MPKIHVIYDPKDVIVTDPAAEKMFGHKVAVLSVPEDMKSIDIYHLAKRLAELLLEQL
jgi:phage terminase small subunit